MESLPVSSVGEKCIKIPCQHDLKSAGSLLADFITSRFSDPSGGIGATAKALLALEERGRWDAEKVSNIVNGQVFIRRAPDHGINIA